MAAQVEAVALQTLVKGTPNVRVETFAAQVLAAGARTVEVEAFTFQVLTPDNPGATEVTGVSAAVTLNAPIGVAAAGSVVLDAAVAGVAAPVSFDAPNGVLSIVSGGSVSLSGASAPVSLDAPAGFVAAGQSVDLAGIAAMVRLAAPAGSVAIGKTFNGPTAKVRLAAPAGQVFAGAIPFVVETVRVAGVTGTTFTLTFTQPVQAGDVVVVSYIGDVSPLGDHVGSVAVSGMGGTWDRTVSDPMNIRTEDFWLVSSDVTTTGSVTVTVDKNFDPMLTGLLIRGTNGRASVDRSQGQDQVYRNSGIGEVIVAVGSADPGSTLDLVNYATLPSGSAWTELPHYLPSGSGTDRQLAYAAPNHADVYALFPYYTTTSYDLATLVVGQAEVDVTIEAGDVASMNVVAPAGTVDAQFEYPPLNGGGTLTLTSGQVVDFVTMPPVTLSVGGTLNITGSSVLDAAVMKSTVLAGGGTVIARPQIDVTPDPRHGRSQWRYVVTDLQNTPLGELVDISHDAVADGIQTPTTMKLVMAANDPARQALIEATGPMTRKCQVWEGNRLLLWGPLLPDQQSDDVTAGYTVHDPSWWWRGGRRVIGRLPRKNLLHNGDFGQGLTYWFRGYDTTSIPQAAPKVVIVEEDFLEDSDGVDPIRAAEITGVESVTESELSSSAVFWPNRPFVYEPLANGFRPGGEAAVDKVADSMPDTAGLKVTIIGHTANDGTGDGLELSLRRAKAAAARIKAKRPNAVIATKGVGFYDPKPGYPVNSQEQRRVVIQYDQTITGKSRQWIRQIIEVTQPKEARYPLVLTAAAMLKVADDWSVPDANMTSIQVVARRKGAAKPAPWDPQLGVGTASISDTDPVDRWIPQTAQVTVPADGRPYLIDVYLFAPAALARYTAVGLFPEEELYFWGVDQALIFKGIAEHIQDPTMGHGDLGIEVRATPTGIRRDRTYPFREHMPADTALEEFGGLNRGFDYDTLTTPDGRVILATFYPQQGQHVDYVLALGGNVAAATPERSRDVASSIIMQAQDLGSYRAEAYAKDARALGGLLLEKVVTAEQETPLNELREAARQELAWGKTTTTGYWLDIDPDSIDDVLANTNKGDVVRLILDAPVPVDRLARIVNRERHPDSLRLLVQIEEA